MYPERTDHRDVAVAHAARHADPLVREAVQALLEENAVLKSVIAEDRGSAFAPRGRRVVGRTVAILLFVAGVAIGTLFIGKSRTSRAFREGFRQGINAGAVPTVPAIPPIQALPAVPAMPAPPADLAPPAPRAPRP